MVDGLRTFRSDAKFYDEIIKWKNMGETHRGTGNLTFKQWPKEIKNLFYAPVFVLNYPNLNGIKVNQSVIYELHRWNCRCNSDSWFYVQFNCHKQTWLSRLFVSHLPVWFIIGDLSNFHWFFIFDPVGSSELISNRFEVECTVRQHSLKFLQDLILYVSQGNI